MTLAEKTKVGRRGCFSSDDIQVLPRGAIMMMHSWGVGHSERLPPLEDKILSHWSNLNTLPSGDQLGMKDCDPPSSAA